MSTFAFARLTAAREAAQPNTSDSTTGLKKYVDALAALVPAEALSLHAVIMSYATQPTADGKGFEITDGDRTTVQVCFFALLALSMGLYVYGKLIAGSWDKKLDYVRIVIPPLAFTGWAMLQKLSAFDAISLGMPLLARTVTALFLAVVLGLAAAALAYQADQTTPVAK